MNKQQPEKSAFDGIEQPLNLSPSCFSCKSWLKFRRLPYQIPDLSKRLCITVLLSILILVGVFFFISKKNQRSLRALSLMTAEERYYLDAFLRDVLLMDHFAYVLFGNKPVAFTSYENSIPFNFSYCYASLSYFNIKKGLEVFKKYQKLFSTRKFFVLINDYSRGTVVVMINKKKLTETFKKHRKDFEKILGKRMTSEEFLAEIEKKGDFGEAINCHEALLGISLGYGRDNAWLFHSMKTALIKMREFDPISLRRWDLVEKEFFKQNGRLGGFGDDSIKQTSFIKKNIVPLPSFRADPNSSETKELKATYEQDRERIKKILIKPAFVDLVFHELIDG